MGDVLVATPVKKSTSGQMSLNTVALNFVRLHAAKRGFAAGIFSRSWTIKLLVLSRPVKGEILFKYL